jgi:mannose-1-phosphate guanylyltransferase
VPLFDRRTRAGRRGTPRRRAASAGTAALIIAGGQGTRFWPESRIGRPKPLFSIDGKNSLLSETVERIRPLVGPERIFVLVSADQAAKFRLALHGLISPRNLLVEPEGRGTAVAITFGAAIIGRRLGSETIVAAMPADHFIRPSTGFRRTIRDAITLAAGNSAIVVVGVRPTRVETGYGYQKIGRKTGVGFRVVQFVEKPPSRLAERMIRSGKFLWNAGMFVMRITTLASELEICAPALARAMRRFPAISRAQLERSYRKLGFDSFDRVVIEKSRNVLGVTAHFKWHDVGSWQGLWEATRAKDANAISGNVMALDAKGVLARGGRRLMVLLGVDDLVAIDTDDTVLIARRSQSQQIRRVIAELRRRGLSRYL